MPIFEVTRKEISYEYVYIDAANKSKAEEIANDLEPEAWRQSQQYECEIDRVEKANPAELKGKYIETENEPYQYIDKTKKQTI